MAVDGQAGVLIGTFVRIQSLADGTPRIVLDLDCTLMEAAALNLLPGAPLAVARMTQKAAQEDLHKKATAGADFGHYYQTLFKNGWFFNPKVAGAFKRAQGGTPTEKQDAIKAAIYADLGVTSLAQVDPERFIAYITNMGIGNTLPHDFGELD